MKKALIITIVILSMILTMLSCNDPVDSDIHSDTENDVSQGIQPIYLNKTYYTQMFCGDYLGNEFDDVREYGAYYKIFTSAEELIDNTARANRMTCLSDVFKDSYVVLIAQFSEEQSSGIIGYKRAIYDENGFGLVLDIKQPRSSNADNDEEMSCIMPIVSYDYIRVPKESIEYVTTDMSTVGKLNLIIQCFEYIYPVCVVTNNLSLQAGDGYIIDGERFEEWAQEKGINATQYGFVPTEDEMVICYYVRSPYCDMARYTGYRVNGGTITIDREVQSNEEGEMKRFVELIKLPKREIPSVGIVEMNNSRIIINTIKPINNVIEENILLEKEIHDYLPTLDAGYYYDVDLPDNEGTYARLIRKYSEFKARVENPTCITEEMFDEYDVVVLKINTMESLKKKSIGFTDYKVGASGIELTLVSSLDINWYGASDMVKEEGILDLIEKVDYNNHYISYILVPKAKEILVSNPNVMLNRKSLENNCNVIADHSGAGEIIHKDGTAWLLRSKEEIAEFEKIYKLSLRAKASSVFVIYFKNSHNISNLQGYEKLCMHGKTINLTLINGREKSFDQRTEGRECFLVIPVADKNMINSYNLEFKTIIKDYESIRLQPEEVEDEIYSADTFNGISIEKVFNSKFIIIRTQEEYENFKRIRDEAELSLNSEYIPSYKEYDLEKYDLVILNSNLPYYARVQEITYKNAHYCSDILYLHKTSSYMVEEFIDLPSYEAPCVYIDIVLLPKDIIATARAIAEIKVIENQENDIILNDYLVPDILEEYEKQTSLP